MKFLCAYKSPTRIYKNTLEWYCHEPAGWSTSNNAKLSLNRLEAVGGFNPPQMYSQSLGAPNFARYSIQSSHFVRYLFGFHTCFTTRDLFHVAPLAIPNGASLAGGSTNCSRRIKNTSRCSRSMFCCLAVQKLPGFHGRCHQKGPHQ